MAPSDDAVGPALSDASGPQGPALLDASGPKGPALLDAPPTLPGGEPGETGTVVWAVALLAALTALVSRGLEPALPGVWVGVDHVITAVRLGAALGSQLVAVTASAVVIALAIATVRSTLPLHVRVAAVLASAVVVLSVIFASATHLPHVTRLVLAGVAALVAMSAVRLSVRLYTLRAASLAVALMAMAGMLRVSAIILVAIAHSQGLEVLTITSRVMATVVCATEALGVATALAWLVWPPGSSPAGSPGRARAARFSALVVVLALAGALTYVAHFGDDPEASGAPLLLARAVRKMLLEPPPYLPVAVRGFLEITAWLSSAAALVVAPRGRLMSGAVAFALIARGSLEVPLCALSLLIAALALVLHPGPALSREIEVLEAQRQRMNEGA